MYPEPSSISNNDFEARLKCLLNELNLLENNQAWSQLLDYLALLQKWNQVYNLTAIRDPEEMFVKHLLDSIVVAPYISGNRIIDVGTGGGLPGIPLAILFPSRQVDLLDSNSKKTRFLIQVKAQLGLKNVQVIHSRVEAYEPAEKYDGVVSRAFASMADMVQWTRHLLVSDGNWWAMKSQKTPEEVAQCPEFVTINHIYELKVPGLVANRVLISASQNTD